MFDLEKINIFLQNNSSKQKIIVIYWPTWSWKTWLSIDLWLKIPSEIISIDSRQIYKYQNIWTWKITFDEMKWIKHHMLDIITPDMTYSVWEFKKEVLKKIQEISSLWKIPILVWWTWMYLDSIIYDFDIPKVIANSEFRQSLYKEASIYWKQYVYEKLQKLDLEIAKTIHPNNLNYVIRAIEVKTFSWKSKLDYKKEHKLFYDTYFLTPYNWNREELYKNINLRVKSMFDNWFIQEVQNILSMWYSPDSPWLQTIWYKEIISYLSWEYSKEYCIELVSQLNRNYAKRQLTWIKDKYKNFEL